jgi:hypothetical protein
MTAFLKKSTGIERGNIQKKFIDKTVIPAILNPVNVKWL